MRFAKEVGTGDVPLKKRTSTRIKAATKHIRDKTMRDKIAKENWSPEGR